MGLRITQAQQQRRVSMAHARVNVAEVQERHGLTDAEMLMVLTEVQASILGYQVRDEHRELK